jgi:hypothetical protein
MRARGVSKESQTVTLLEGQETGREQDREQDQQEDAAAAAAKRLTVSNARETAPGFALGAVCVFRVA